MAKWKPWLKMWVEWVHDPKMLSLSLAEQCVWWRILALAQECNAGGALTKGNGTPLTLEEIAMCIHLRISKDISILESMVKKMEALGSLNWNSKILTITHFAERQAKTSSETSEAIRERVRRHREQKAETENPLQETLPSSPPNPPITKVIEGEAEAECNGIKPVTFVPALAKISQLYEELFGNLTPILCEKFKDFVENYRGPPEWIDQAFAEAVRLKNRRWAYVEAILNNWQEKGGPHADRREPGGEGERLGAGERDTLKTYREGGWEVTGEDEPEIPEAGN